MNDIDERTGELMPSESESSMIAVLNKSEIDQQISTAKKYPRSIVAFRREALEMVTLSEAVAESCIYAIPRDGKTIEGPSARFAEIIVSAWGNTRSGARVVSDAGEFVTAQGVFHDLERNNSITYEVQRRIVNRSGKRFGTDMIGVTANAACSIALRNAILKGVPKAFWEEMYNAARKTIMGDYKTLNNRRAEALAQFQKFGVSAEKVCYTLEVAGVEDIGLEHLVVLRGILTAIRDGDTTAEMAFAIPEGGKPPVKAPLSKGEQNAKTEAQVAAQIQAQAQAGQEQPTNTTPSSQAATPPSNQATKPPKNGNGNVAGVSAAGIVLPAGGEEFMATDGEKHWLTTKLKQRSLSLDEAYTACNLTIGQPLTADRFIVIKEYLAQTNA